MGGARRRSGMRPAALALLMLSVLVALPAPARAEGAVDLAAMAGHGGWVRSGTWAPLAVTLVSRGDALSGLLTVQTAGAAGLAYRQPVLLPAGARRELQIPVLIEGNGPITVRLTDGAGQPAASVSVQPRPLDDFTLLAATLSADPDAFIPLGAAQPAAGVRVAVVPLDPIAFPDHPLLLESFDLLAVARVDTGLLRLPQRQALEVWVRQGGTLLLAGGPEWRRTLAGLPEALWPVQVAGSAVGPLPADLARWLNPPEAPVTLATGMLAPDSAPVLGPADGPLVAVRPVGRGRVVYLAADPTLEPLASWPGVTTLWERLLLHVPLANQVQEGDLLPGGRSAGTRAPVAAGPVVEGSPSLGLPPVGVAAGFLAVYICLAGPLSYLALRRPDRRIWLWWAAPALALVSVGAIYLGAFGRGQQVVTHLVGVYDLVPGMTAAGARTYVGIYAPTVSELEAGLAPGVLVSPLPFDPDGEGEAVPEAGRFPIAVIPGPQPVISLSGLGMYRMAGFTAEHTAELPGTVEFDLVYRDGAVTGTIANRTGQTLHRATAYTWGAFQQFFDIPAGETVEVNVPLGEPNAPATGYYLAADKLPLRRLDTRQQRLTLEMTLGAGREWDTPPFTFVAWAAAAPDLPGGVAEMGRVINALNLYYARPVPRIDPERPDLPPGVVRPRLLHSSSGGQIVTAGPLPNYNLPGGRMVLSFLPPPLEPAGVAAMDLHLNLLTPLTPEAVTVRVRNWETGQWDEVAPQEKVSLSRWRPYFGPGGEVQVEVQATEEVSLLLPTLSFRGAT